MRFRALLILVFFLSAAPAVHAVMPDEILKNDVLEQRARHLSSELRCMVCQNQSIDDLLAPLARDLRLLVRERLVAGDSDEQVRAFLVARYGDFILLKPPFQYDTYILWLGPFIIFAIGFYVIFIMAKRYQPKSSDEKLTEDEMQKLSALMNEGQADLK